MLKFHRKPLLSRAAVPENSALPLNRHRSRRLRLQSQRFLKSSTLLLRDESLCKLNHLTGIENPPLAPLRNRRQCAPDESVNEKGSESENENTDPPLTDRKWRPKHERS